ncbi:MAG: DUF1674 domain-containing protein [Gammaproteobacteria bacterium]
MVKTMTAKPEPGADTSADSASSKASTAAESPAVTHDRAPATSDVEVGGRDGPDPTRYGDWEKNGRCIDF